MISFLLGLDGKQGISKWISSLQCEEVSERPCLAVNNENQFQQDRTTVPPPLPDGTPRPDRRARTERRSNPRYHFTATAEILDLGSRAQCSARTSDISLGGCFVDTTSPFAVGTVTKVRLTKERESLIAAAVVASSMTGMGMGLRFTNVEAQQSRVLEKWIGELSGELPKEFEADFDEANSSQAASDEVRLQGEHQYILNELIVALMRRGILSEAQGKEMLRRLLL